MRDLNISREHTLLLSRPDLLDPAFYKSVIYISSDSQKGAVGFILNRRISLSLSEIDKSFKGTLYENLPLYDAGPVERTKLHFATFLDDELFGKKMILLQTQEQAKKYIENSSIVWAFVGHCAWGKNQLEEEISRKDSWVLSPFAGELVLHKQNQSLWQKLIYNQDKKAKSLSNPPFLPNLN